MSKSRIALFLPSLRGGGAERAALNLSHGFVNYGIDVDIVLARATGQYLSTIPPEARVIDLNSRRVLTSLPGLVRYLRRERPDAIISFMNHANIVAILAKTVSRTNIPVIATVHTNQASSREKGDFKQWIINTLVQYFYKSVDHVVAVSEGVAQSIVSTTILNEADVKVIYNPVVMPDTNQKAQAPVTHPWLDNREEIPIIFGVGRFNRAKNFLLHIYRLLKFLPGRSDNPC